MPNSPVRLLHKRRISPWVISERSLPSNETGSRFPELGKSNQGWGTSLRNVWVRARARRRTTGASTTRESSGDRLSAEGALGGSAASVAQQVTASTSPRFTASAPLPANSPCTRTDRAGGLASAARRTPWDEPRWVSEQSCSPAAPTWVFLAFPTPLLVAKAFALLRWTGQGGSDCSMVLALPREKLRAQHVTKD